MHFEYSMDYRNFSSFHFEHNNLSHTYMLILVVCKKQQVTTVKGRLHATTAQANKSEYNMVLL